ncbi:MAG: hypothetical protein Q8Q50_15185 [Methylobacter sp.]|jgi:hypothetical protein|nr:hypothetical protein [Methylobacter sp.]
MQITLELDNQHIEKLHALENQLKINASELVAVAIDKIFNENKMPNEGQAAYQLMLQSGFIGCVELDENLSENYKDYLDWSHKL